MDWNYLLLWIGASSCIINFVRATRLIPRLKGWMGITGGILAATGVTWAYHPDKAGFVAAGCWFVFVLIPTLLQRRISRLTVRQHFSSAGRVANILKWFHPFDGLWQQPRLLHALDVGDHGEIDAAVKTLEELAEGRSQIARSAHMHLRRLREEWPQLVDWVENTLTEPALRRDPIVLANYLRALGETGQVEELLIMLYRCRTAIDSPIYSAPRNMCRVYAFAFSGRPEQTAAVLSGPLSQMPESIQHFWLGTAELAAGMHEEGQIRLLNAQSGAKPHPRTVIASRLASPPAPAHQLLSEESRKILDRLERESEQEERFSARHAKGRRPWGTYLFVIANFIMFAIEWDQGGTTNLDTLYQLGAFETGAVNGGEFWRLLTANFLHLGVAHIAMNMAALLVLGPFVEAAVGFFWFVPLYLLGGVGAISSVWILQRWGFMPRELLVGASGAIMGLIGATGGILLRGWFRERARIASRRMRVILVIVGCQVVFDLLTPQVSGTAHLAGAVWGFLLVNLIPHRTSASRRVS